MKPRYVVINEVDRNEFENKWQMPFGYGDCEIHLNFDDAKDELDAYYGTSEWIIEKVTDGGRQKVFTGGYQEA